MNRTTFYSKVTVDNTEELDFLYNSLSDFEMVYEPSYYRVSAGDIGRADLISQKVYGTVKFWWIIMLVNNLDNPIIDIEVGTILTIPHKFDIYAFQKKYRLRKDA